MKVGDLVRYKHFPDESAVVIKVHPSKTFCFHEFEGVHAIDVLSNLGEIAVLLDPAAFEVINESR